jgi:hypothetical protein
MGRVYGPWVFAMIGEGIGSFRMVEGGGIRIETGGPQERS